MKDTENYTAVERVIADAGHGVTFDELLETPVRGVRVNMSPDIPGPVPAHAAVGFGTHGMVCRRRRDSVAVTMVWLVVWVVAAIVGNMLMVAGFLAALVAVGGSR